MAVYGRTVKERQEREREINERYALTLQNANKKKEKRQSKRQSVDVLRNKIVTDLTSEYIIRPLESYPNRSYNADKQVHGLIRHLFVKYPVPRFLYDVCRKDYKPKHPKMHADYLMWFLALAQGQSFTKLVKPYMTAKEAHCFLSAPYETVHENVWWAKLKSAGVPQQLIGKLIDRIFNNYFFVDETGRLSEVIVFYAHYHADMDKHTFGEVTDFIAWKLRNDREFRFKGRTASSMVKLANEWQVLMQKAKIDHSVEWTGMGIKPWKHMVKSSIWTMQELLTNKELLNEGRKQRHCVYSYVQSCADGRCSIFSLREYHKTPNGKDEDDNTIWVPYGELERITVEVRNRSVVQVQKRLNTPPEPREIEVLRQWAGDNGITGSWSSFGRRRGY